MYIYCKKNYHWKKHLYVVVLNKYKPNINRAYILCNFVQVSCSSGLIHLVQIYFTKNCYLLIILLFEGIYFHPSLQAPKQIDQSLSGEYLHHVINNNNPNNIYKAPGTKQTLLRSSPVKLKLKGKEVVVLFLSETIHISYRMKRFKTKEAIQGM